MKPYDNSLEHLLDELSRIDLLIKTYLENWLEEFPGAGDEFRGLYVSETEIEGIRRSPGFGSTQGMLQDIQVEKLREINAIRKEIDARIEESLKIGRELRFHRLSELFGLDPFEIDILLIGLAPELDLRYEKLYAYLQNDMTKKKPTVDLVLSLLFPTIEEKIKSRAYFSPSAPLRKNHLIHLLEGEEQAGLSFVASSVKIDERVINFLIGFDEPDLKVRNYSYVVKPKRSFEDLILPLEFKSRLMSIASWSSESKFPLNLLFCGPSGSGKKTAAEAVCREAGINLLVVDSKVFLESRSPETAYLIIREALLQNSALYLQDFGVLLDDKEPKNFYEILVQAFKTFPSLIFMAGKESMEFNKSLINNGFIPYLFPLPTHSVRKKLWDSCLKDYRLAEEVDLNALASKFRFSGGQIRDAIFVAHNKTMVNGSTSLSMECIYQGCKAQSNRNLSSLARKIEPHYNWDDIILPKDTKRQLSEVSGYIKHRGIVYIDWGFDKKLSLGKGLNVLFCGPSGTGKTMAAEIIAKDSGLDLYKIDLSCVVSKYIGETEKNLSKIFNEAQTSNAILFFDEADALFGKRSEVKDAHDRYANIETGYLLQKMEEYEGIVILATNLHRNIDDAFLRRMQFVIEFPFPDEKLRLQIWTRIFPKDAPLAKDVNYKFFSDKLKLAGGNIKNIALTAAFQAAEESCEIGMRQIMHATKREYQKIGKPFLKVDFEPHYNLIESDEI